ncbi:MAG: TetR/AcrR family transcriptional regulator [Candidatus Phosphoribacter sp.]
MPRITDARRAARRIHILRAAIRCVTRSGFQGMTMGDVIAESGLSAGAVYGYFGSKNELLAAVADHNFAGLGGIVARAAGDGVPPAPADMLEAMIAGLLEVAVTEDGDLTIVAVQIWGQAVLGGDIQDLMSPRIHLVLDQLTGLARRWQQAGFVAPDADPESVARVFLALVPGFMLQRLVIGEQSAADFSAGLRALTAARAASR